MTVQTKIDIAHSTKLSRDASAPHRPHGKRALLIGAGLLALAASGWFGWHYWNVGRFEISTDDAYVKADSTTAAPKVSGYLDAVLVQDNQHVKAGQVLAHIDDRDFRASLDQARANVAAAEANIEHIKAALEIQRSVIDAAHA